MASQIGRGGDSIEADERLVHMVVERERDPENRRPTGRDERRETSRILSFSLSLSLERERERERDSEYYRYRDSN